MPKRKHDSPPAHTEPIVRVLRPEELGFGRMFNQLSDAVVVTDAESGLIVLWNASAEAIFGYSVEEAVGMLLEDLLPGRYRDRYQKGIKEFLDTGKTRLLGSRIPVELPTLAKDGHEVIVELTLSRIDDAEVPGLYILALLRDVTERHRLTNENRRSEALLREKGALLSAIIENTSDVIFVKDMKSRYLMINEAGAAVIGQPISAILGHTDDELMGPENARAFRHHEQLVTEARHPLTMEEQVRLADGREETFLTTKHPLLDGNGRSTGIVGISHKITERKRAEVLLRTRAHHQQSLSQLGQRALSGMAIEELFEEAARLVATTLQADFVEVLELLPDRDQLQLVAGTGWSPGLIRHATVPSGMSSQAGYTLIAREAVVVTDLARETRFQAPPLLRDHQVTSGVSVVISGREVPFGVLGAFSRGPRTFREDDIAFLQGVSNVLALAIARKETEAALTASETRWRTLVENAPQIVAILDLDGHMQFLNRGAPGFDPQALIGRSIYNFLTAEEQLRIRQVYQRVLFTGQPETYETRAVGDHGTIGWYQVAVGLLRQPNELPSFIAIAADITSRVQAEESAKASEMRWRALVDHAPEVIVEVDRGYRIQFVNHTAPGHNAAEVIGQSIFEYVPVEEHARLKAIFDRVFADGRPARYEVHGLGPDGGWTWYQSSIGPLGAPGAVETVVVLSRDISEEKQAIEALRASEQQLAKAQAIAHMGNWAWDLDHDRVTWSEELYEIFGVSREINEISIQEWRDMVHPEDRESIVEAIEATRRDGTPFSLEYRTRLPDGTVHHILSRGEAERDASGRIVRVVGTAQDVTEVKETAAALAQRTEELRHARELDHLKSSFVNSVSHELRTPLTSIVGYAEFLEDELGGPISEDQREYIDEILKGARRLERLVDDLLDFARIDAGTFRLRLESVDLGAKADEIVASLQPQAKAAQLALTLQVPEQPLEGRLDPQRIGQVLINLVGNAIKFTPAGGKVTVTITEADGQLRGEVADTGPGISPEDQSKLFQRFSQLKNSRRKGGAGLGLSISKALVEAHGGQIGVVSDVNRGASFWFTIPRDGPPDEGRPEEPPA